MINESILDSIKAMLGIDPLCEDFDLIIINHINSAFMTLSQLGVGPEGGFRIRNNSIYLKVKMIFDPPINGSVIESYKESIRELEWRLMIQKEE